jgi:hypothetical protein
VREFKVRYGGSIPVLYTIGDQTEVGRLPGGEYHLKYPGSGGVIIIQPNTTERANVTADFATSVRPSVKRLALYKKHCQAQFVVAAIEACESFDYVTSEAHVKRALQRGLEDLYGEYVVLPLRGFYKDLEDALEAFHRRNIDFVVKE